MTKLKQFYSGSMNKSRNVTFMKFQWRLEPWNDHVTMIVSLIELEGKRENSEQNSKIQFN